MLWIPAILERDERPIKLKWKLTDMRIKLAITDKEKKQK